VWLKANNYYYKNIIIDQEIFQSLSENDFIVKMLLQLQNNRSIDKILANKESEDDEIAHSFISSNTLK